MLSFREPFKNWFGYNRRERRSTFILLIMIVAIVGLRFVLPGREVKIEKIPYLPWKSLSDTLPAKKASVFKTKPGGGKVTPERKRLLDINTCDSISLEKLPGIGPVLSVRIVKYRHLLGGYASIDQLNEVYGLTEETFKLISGRIFADSGAVKKIQINIADFRQLIRLPYFERYEVVGILKYRELEGRIKNIDDLIDNKIITIEKAVKVRPYLEFDE